MKKDLQQLGLTKNESLVYEQLVHHGPCKAGLIIPKLDIHRNLVYRALESLIEGGYVTKVIERGVWHFHITDPHILLTNIRRREEVFTSVLQEIESHQSRKNNQIVVYDGIESYRRFWIDSLKRVPDGTVDYVAGGELTDWYPIMGEKCMKEYFDIARKKKIEWRQIYFEKDPKEIQKLKNASVPHQSRLVKLKKPLKFAGNFNVMHDFVLLHTMGKTPRIIEMRDKDLVSLFKNYFDVLWEQGEEV